MAGDQRCEGQFTAPVPVRYPSFEQVPIGQSRDDTLFEQPLHFGKGDSPGCAPHPIPLRLTRARHPYDASTGPAQSRWGSGIAIFPDSIPGQQSSLPAAIASVARVLLNKPVRT